MTPSRYIRKINRLIISISHRISYILHCYMKVMWDKLGYDIQTHLRATEKLKNLQK